MNEQDKKKLIAHIIEQSRGQEIPSKVDEFENLLFEARVRQFLLKEASK